MSVKAASEGFGNDVRSGPRSALSREVIFDATERKTSRIDVRSGHINDLKGSMVRSEKRSGCFGGIGASF